MMIICSFGACWIMGVVICTSQNGTQQNGWGRWRRLLVNLPLGFFKRSYEWNIHRFFFLLSMRMRKKSRVCLTHCYKLVHFAINWLAINFILLSGPGVPIPFFFVVIGPNLALQPIVINCSYPKFEVHRYGLPLKQHLWSFHDEARKFSWALLLLALYVVLL